MHLTRVVCAAIVGAVLACENVQHVKSKEEYGVLQSIEYEHRGTPVRGIEIVEKNGYQVAGFRANGRDENVWVLLNPRYSPHYKQVPEAPFKVTQRDIEVVRRTPGVSKDVLAALEARMSGQGS